MEATAIPTVAEQLAQKRTVAEQLQEQELINKHNKLASYAPPIVHVGQDICWFEGGDPGRQPLIGKVQAVRGKSINVLLIGAAQFYTNVRYIDDPALENPNYRQNGAWDFTPATVADRAERQAIKELLDAQSKTMNELTAALAESRRAREHDKEAIRNDLLEELTGKHAKSDKK